MTALSPFPEAILSPEISAEAEAVAAAKAQLATVTDKVQGDCAHRIVSEAPYTSAVLPARRICNHCRIEEEGSHWSGGSTWSQADFEPAVLGNDEGRVVVPITREELYTMRVRP